jgi:hypothetical protein
MSAPPTAFVAYTSKDKQLATVIAKGVGKANATNRAIRLAPWEFSDIAGVPITSPIIQGIDSSQYVVADVTYLNPNVVYEVGFAIGRKKRAYLIRMRGIEGDSRIAQVAGIFDTLGYEEYGDDEELCHRLTSYIDPAALEFSETLDRLAPVYVVEPLEKSGVATLMTSRLKKARYRYRRFDPAEDSRLSASDAIRQVASSSGVLVSMFSDKDDGNIVHNIRSLFVAGLADGMGKPSLILVHNEVVIPMDIRDSAKRFGFPKDISDHIAAFSLEITDYSQQADPVQLRSTNLLQSLAIGDPTAENEMTTLGEYFLATDQYNRAVRGEVNLVVGKKGTGKTALWIQIRDRIRSDKRNVVVDLKPEGYQLLKLKEDLLAHLTQGASQHLLTAFWEYLILLEVAYKLLEKDRNTYKYNHEIRDLYIELDRAYRVDSFSAEGDFSERLLDLSQRIAQDYVSKFGSADSTRLSTEDVTRLVYAHDIRVLRDRIAKYLTHKSGVWILFDNLDKGWSTQGVDVVDATVLRCLIDAGRKLERDMRKSGFPFHCVVFIRNDVYEFVMKQSSDYGKEMRATLDWTDADLLRELLRLRLVAALGEKSIDVPFDKLWATLCVSHYKGEETSSYIIERSLMRPRNVLKIFSHARGFASNLNHGKITETDLEKGVRAYSQDLVIELDHELTDVFPAAHDLLYHFVDCPQNFEAAELERRILEAGIERQDLDRVKDFLLYYGILGIRHADEVAHYIFDVNYDLKVLHVRAARAGENLRFALNPAFGPALGTFEAEGSTGQHRLI